MENQGCEKKDSSVEMYEHRTDEAQHAYADLPNYADTEATAITRKIDLGNARALGMQTDIGLTDKQWNLCLTIFFFPYAALEVPSNIVLKFLKPNIWLSILVTAWGTVVVLTGIVHNYSGLLAVRFFLGVTEAGFFPAATYLLTCWYKRHELQSRMAIFYSAGSMAGALSGLLAYGINYMDGVASLEGWRWIMILEGILTVMIGCICPFILPNSPASADFLTAPEKAYILQGLQNDSGSTGQVETSEKYHKRYIFAALRDFKIYISVLIYWGNAISNYGQVSHVCRLVLKLTLHSFIYTLPTVIRQLGYTAANAQLLTIPVYAFALSTTVAVAIMSDRYKMRSPFIMGPFVVAAAGYIALMALPHPGLPGATYGMLFVVAGGLYPSICGVISWNANNLAGSWKRSVGMALQISIGNLGGAIGSNIYLAKEAPHYWTGYGVSLTIIVISILATGLLRFVLDKENKRREKMTIEEINEKYTEQELLELGDKSPLFRQKRGAPSLTVIAIISRLALRAGGLISCHTVYRAAVGGERSLRLAGAVAATPKCRLLEENDHDDHNEHHELDEEQQTQQAFRQRTRDYIADLEERLAMQARISSRKLAKLNSEVQGLRRRCHELQRRLDSIGQIAGEMDDADRANIAQVTQDIPRDRGTCSDRSYEEYYNDHSSRRNLDDSTYNRPHNISHNAHSEQAAAGDVGHDDVVSAHNATCTITRARQLPSPTATHHLAGSPMTTTANSTANSALNSYHNAHLHTLHATSSSHSSPAIRHSENTSTPQHSRHSPPQNLQNLPISHPHCSPEESSQQTEHQGLSQQGPELEILPQTIHQNPGPDETAYAVHSIRPPHLPPACPLDRLLLNLLQSRMEMIAQGSSLDAVLGPVKGIVTGFLDQSLATAVHPISRIVCEILSTFPNVALPERMGMFYKMHLTLRWQISPTFENYNQMPLWLRPTVTQITVPHSAWIDNIPWPGVRDLLIRHPDVYIFEDFSEYYSQNVTVNWKFDDSDAVAHVKGNVVLHSIFEKHVRKLENWTVSGSFQRRFPEMVPFIFGKVKDA
ncbi:hypothetical protein OPT61_g2333 [Boeremia exigua]|uniref:Uncharacterized protein n=1 Tax=Boeremia exigua TaxID=749465 RepID=A0ACC2ILW5_9PLEO|nr:hypothetical protein OPT61_g2333 [Boeremia exigua]